MLLFSVIFISVTLACRITKTRQLPKNKCLCIWPRLNKLNYQHVLLYFLYSMCVFRPSSAKFLDFHANIRLII